MQQVFPPSYVGRVGCRPVAAAGDAVPGPRCGSVWREYCWLIYMRNTAELLGLGWAELRRQRAIDRWLHRKRMDRSGRSFLCAAQLDGVVCNRAGVAV